MSRLRRRFADMTFQKKMLLLWLLIGVIPILLLMAVFIVRVSRLMEYQNQYALRQNFEQTHQSITNMVEGMEETASFLLADGNVQSAFSRRNASLSDREYLGEYENIEESRRIFVDSTSVDEIVFYLDPALPMVGSSAGNKYRDISLISGEEWCCFLLEGGGFSDWGIIKTDPVGFMENYLCYVHVIQDAEDYVALTGLICLGIELDTFEELLMPIMEGQSLYLETSRGIAASSDPSITSFGTVEKEGNIRKEGTEWYYLSGEIGNTGMTLVSAIPEAILSRQIMRSLSGLAAVMLILLGIICILYLKISRRLTERIISLAEICRKSENGVLEKVPDDGRKDEIGVLCRSYNRMTDRIDELLVEQYRIGEEVKDAQLKALQAQINPHFLYNTLEMVSWMAAREDKKGVQNIVRSLSRYYKTVLNKGKDELDIWDEIRMGISYMEIQSFRFKGKINFVSETDETIPEVMVPKLILQPLLENAIFHGINKKPEGRGNIWMRAYREEGWIVLEVSDDGVGFRYEKEEDSAASSRQEEHIGSKYGLTNVERRIGLFWKREASLQVESTPGIGTSVYIRIPCRKETV